jgi:hypothetical protein
VLTCPQGSRGLAVVQVCLEEVVFLVVCVVMVARISSRVGVATYARINVELPASCRQKRFEMYYGM